MDGPREAGPLIGKIKPPRLEDAGLEDCALPPESIKEAFLKAASAVGSIISASNDERESESRYADVPREEKDNWRAAEKGGGLTVVPGAEVSVAGDLPETDGFQGGLNIGEEGRGISGKKVGLSRKGKLNQI